MRSQVFGAGALFLLTSLFATPALAADQGALGVMLSRQPSTPTNGVVVTGVMAGSPAHQAGIQPADRILAIDGHPVSSYQDVLHLVQGKPPGAMVQVKIARGAWRTNVTTYLGQKQLVFQAQQLTQPPSPYPTLPLARAPTWNQPYWWTDEPGWSPGGWPTHPRDNLLTSLYNSDF